MTMIVSGVVLLSVPMVKVVIVVMAVASVTGHMVYEVLEIDSGTSTTMMTVTSPLP